jgi:hypothetical protein
MARFERQPESRDEAVNRSFKALCIFRVLERFELTGAEIRQLDDAGWKAAVRIAAKENATGWDDASAHTRSVVASLADRADTITLDPFEGFPR